MLIEIIVYIALFATLFSGAFSAAFQTVDAVQYLQVQKNAIDNLYFFRAELNQLVRSRPDWGNISQDTVTQLISATSSSSSPALLIDSFSSEILETATSSSRVLILTIGINKKSYTFSYVQEK